MKSLTLHCTLLPKIDQVHHGLPSGGSVPGYIPLNQWFWCYSISKAMLSRTYLVDEEETSGSGTANSGASYLPPGLSLLHLCHSDGPLP